MPDLLSELAVKYGSDKWSAKHSYTAWYYAQFAARRETVRKVVEIGVGEGASLRMWREFFPNAIILGADREQDRLINEDGIKCIKYNQEYGVELYGLLEFIGHDVDLFIDDGSHLEDDQVTTCLEVLPHLCASVTYVIEDVAEVDIAARLAPHVIYVPALEKRARYDNRLFVVKCA